MKDTTKAHHRGMYDAWHQASFAASYGRVSAWAAPTYTDPTLATRYVEGFRKGQERFAAGQEVVGRQRTAGWEAYAPFFGTPAFTVALQDQIQAVTTTGVGR